MTRPDDYSEAYRRVKPVVSQWAVTGSLGAEIACPANCGGRLSMRTIRTGGGNLVEVSASCSTAFCVSLKE